MYNIYTTSAQRLRRWSNMVCYTNALCLLGNDFSRDCMAVPRLTRLMHDSVNMTALAVKTFRSLENTQCFKDQVLNHEIVQKQAGSNTILDQLLAAIQADA